MSSSRSLRGVQTVESGLECTRLEDVGSAASEGLARSGGACQPIIVMERAENRQGNDTEFGNTCLKVVNFFACRSSLLIGARTAGSCAPATRKKARSTPARQCRAAHTYDHATSCRGHRFTWSGSAGSCGKYRDTVISETKDPSFVSSAWIRGAPQPS